MDGPAFFDRDCGDSRVYPRELPKVLFIPLFLYALYGVKKAVSLKREEDGEKAIEEWK